MQWGDPEPSMRLRMTSGRGPDDKRARLRSQGWRAVAGARTSGPQPSDVRVRRLLPTGASCPIGICFAPARVIIVLQSMSASRARFCLVLVKPSHYDDDGYVIQWFRSAIPSNSLACLYGLANDCAQRQVLGEDVELEIHAFDETNTRIRPERIAAMVEAAGSGMVLLVGVQSNQFPRALDIAAP